MQLQSVSRGGLKAHNVPDEQMEAIRGSQLLSRILREQRQSLPVVVPRRDLQDEIADLRLKQFGLIFMN